MDQGKVEFVWKDFPLSFHENAFEMAVAGRCAKNYSNKYFWNYQNALFALMNSKLERIPSISTTDLQNIAEEIGIGGTDFNDCLKKQAVKIVLDQDASDAKKATVNATPTFFINQYKVEGTLNTADFEKIITTILEETEGSAIRIPGEGNAKIEIPGKTEPIPADKIKIPSRPAPNLPDLFLTKIQFRAEKSLEGKELDEFKVNTPVYLYTTIESIGQQKISSSFGLSIYVDGELFLTQSLNQEQLDALNSGKPVTVNETFVSFSTNGNHEIKAVVDSFENINEANENNNDIIRKINVLGENEDTNNQCSGCSESNSCIPLGTRVVDNSNKAQYCDLSKTVKDQKETGSSCQNNFECLSNSCSNSVCVDVKGLANQQQETNQLLKQLIDLLQSIFRALGLKG
ncbi:MAG: thioredoxin domain-containing protein [Candidatus Diapherotrites archaeon]|nr:thioredoxin domain-containing protein [Candidatus Diapherotrites archaeon]